jgi:hypothetical protein
MCEEFESFLGESMFGGIAACTTYMRKRGWFPILWSFVGVVSAFDTYLTFRFQDVLRQLESNPVGRYLIEIDGGNVNVFIRTKVAGTIVVLGVLAALHVYRRRWSFPITASIAAFQFALVVYIGLSTPVGQPSVELTLAFPVDDIPPPRTVWDDVFAFLPTSGWEPPSDAVRMQ